MSVCFFLSFYFMGNFFNFFPILGIFLKFSLFFFPIFFQISYFYAFSLQFFVNFVAQFARHPG